ncbi:peptidoglycan-binding protein [Paenibacillus motobuensis]|uniref:peptidoglycan-binding domain-containing protein n=1 Tax=Paenibacillus TaxID=44249 RepID=UPI00203DD452|nr:MULTISPECIES: peptidoglycan-binding protein [Paenibacillus]MCM3042805.1 peptidoglycan-binding protein [Paenibacillus lutimineralis]MCM3649909.1 peptidoglycan-binding protein [Paenibacillus motobuensis]
MEQKVNPNQVEGLAGSLGRLNRMIEDQVTGMCKDVSRVVGDTRARYSEDYVGRAADEVERLIQEIQQLALAIDDQLQIKEKTLRWAAGEYVEREKEAIRKIEEMQQKKIPLVLSREALFQEKNQALSPFGVLPVYPFVLTASVSLPVYIPPLSEELSLNPEKYSEEVLRLQQRLKELGYEVEANGYFDEETLKAVNQFKDNYGLENRRSAAGVVDDQMWRYLFGNLNGILTKDSGVYSDPVKMVQSRLKELGFDIEATGYYDEQTQRAIDGFREIYGKDLSGADGVIGEQTWNALFNIKVPQPQYTIGAYDPYNSVDVNDILNRDDPEVQKRLEQTYWATLSKEEQDRRYREIKEEMDAIDKKWADKMRRAQSGIGNQFFANLITGTSNAVVNTINTASAGLPELITEWIMGPMPEGYVDPLDDPYGKKAGVIAGNMVGFFLPFKYLKGIKTPALLTKLSPTVLRSVTAEAIFSGVTEVSDSVTDFRKDGDQSLGERLFNIAFNSSAAGVGDVAFTYAFKTISNMLKSTGAQKILEYIRPKKIAEGTPKTASQNEEVLDMYRRTSNTGEFSHLEVPMQLREVKRLAEQAGVGLDGVKIKIIRDPEMLDVPFGGWANPNGREIQLYPNAFINEEQLIKTLAHERTHIFQVRTYGHAADDSMLRLFEDGAYGIEDTFWDYFKKKGN